MSLSILAAQTLGGILLARSLGPAGRGEFAALVLWAALAFDVATLGTPGAVAYWAASPDPRAGLRLVRRVYPVLALAGVAVFAILLLLSGRAGSLALVGILAFGLWVPIRIAVVPMIRYEQGRGRMVVFNRLRAVPEIGPVLGYTVAAMFGVLTVGVASTSVLVFLVVAGWWAMREIGRHGAGHTAASDGVRGVSPRAFWKYSLAEWVSVLATKGNRTIDLFLLTMLAVSTSQIGLYAVAATAAAVLAVVGVSLGMVLFPRVTASDSEGDRKSLIRRHVSATAAIALIGAVGFVLIADWLVPLVYGDGFNAAVAPARVLAFGGVGLAVARVAGEALKALGRPGIVAIGEVVGAVVTVAGILIVGTGSLSAVAAAASVGFAITMLFELIALWRWATA